jgi:endonuclease/exonuclease/phosphatase (EEP) superfamily protein YafD
MLSIALVLVYAVSALAIAATLLPLWRTTRWWVRVCDFPRFQIAVVAFGAAAALVLLARSLSLADLILIAALLAAAAWQISWVWRYLPGAPREIEDGEAAPGAPERVGLLTTNVLLTSRDASTLLDIIRDADPDIVLAVETDEWWCDRLADGLRSNYPHSLLYPLSNGYGLALFSRLELIDPSIQFVVDEAIPSIHTGVRLRSNVVIDLYGLHPRPPAVRQDSTERDTELVRIGMRIKDSGRPSIAIGDLNDVAWSPTTLEFTEAGALKDPRRGRGFFNTYPARWPGFRYPLDYIFITHHFTVCEMRVLPRFASDHLPLLAALCLKPS